jgi:hypothetical protein
MVGKAFTHCTSTKLSVTPIEIQTIISRQGYPDMFTIHEIANGLKEMLSEQKFVEAYKLLFSDDAESIDPLNTSGQPLKGLTTLLDREKDFLSRITAINKITLSDPIIAGSYFTMSLKMSFEVQDQGHMEVEEICLYKVKNGKIISQQFFIG